MVRKFDYSFLKDKIPGKIVSLLSIVYDIKGKENARLISTPALFNKLKKKAIRDSIKASNAIENIHTTEKRIDDIANGDNFAYTHPEKEIIGYRNTLNNIHTFNETIIFDETSILALHKQLLDVAEVGGRGNYKKEPNVISEKINLSGGERQRVALARALLKNASVYILDEPTASLDPINAESVKRVIDKLSKKKFVILVTHDMDILEAPRAE